MPSCPACGRSVAVARAECLYCGAPLGGHALASAPPPVELQAPEPGASDRVLVLLDLTGAAAETLAAALGLSLYEAGLLARRGGIHLARAVSADEAAAEQARLAAAGARAWLVPESEARTPPLVCLAGEQRDDALLLRTSQGPVRFAAAGALMVVRGSIAREYAASEARRRIESARPAEGYRWHLHRGLDPRPLEIDALNFEVGAAGSGSARLELDAWLEAVAGSVPRDDGFARLPPALAPAEPEASGTLAAVGTLAAARARSEGRPLLDNVAQFRFYSGCVAAVARRRADAGARG